MTYKISRLTAVLAIAVLLAGAVVAGILGSMSKESLQSAAANAGYQSISETWQNSVAYGTAQHLQAKVGTCSVTIFRRDTNQGYWYSTYYDKEQLSSDDHLPSAQDASMSIKRSTGTVCTVRPTA